MCMEASPPAEAAEGNTQSTQLNSVRDFVRKQPLSPARHPYAPNTASTASPEFTGGRGGLGAKAKIMFTNLLAFHVSSP